MGINKKASAMDIFLFMIIALALAITCVIMLYVANVTEIELYENLDVLQAAIGPNENMTLVLQDTFGAVPRAFESFKWITGMLIFGMMLSILLSSYLVRVNPIWLVPYIFVWIIAIICSVVLSNSYETIMQHPTLASTFAGFWAQNYIFAYLPIWITIIGGAAAALMVINLVKQNQAGGYI